MAPPDTFPRLRLSGLAVVLCFTVWAQASRAGTDPERRYSTFETEHFAVHFYDGGDRFARRVASYCEEARADLLVRIGWAPKERVHVVVTDEVDDSNGFTTVLPYPTFTLWARPPAPDGELGRFDDWLRMLVFHEYAHVVHLDAASGVPELFNGLFGRVWKPNTALPRWVTEGFAVWVESTRTAGGRIGSPLTEMHLRTMALEGRLPDLSELAVPPLARPRSALWYLLGGAIFDEIARQKGELAVAAFVAAYGTHPIPFALNTLSRQATGKTMVDWYADVRRDIEARAQAHAGADPAGAKVLRSVREVIENPVFSPDGRALVWVEGTGFESTRIVTAPFHADGQIGEPRTIIRCEGGCGRPVFSRDGRRLVFSTARHHRVSNYYSNLAEIPFETGLDRRAPRIIRGSMRAYDAIPTADGRALLAAQTTWGEASVERIDLDTHTTTRVVGPEMLGRFDDLAATADGKTLFMSAHIGVERDLYRVDLETGTLTELTHGGRLEIDTRLSPDERWLVYASDRDGTWNLYAMEVATGVHHRLTQIRTGAFQPTVSPDNRFVVFQKWNASGPSLVVMPFSPGEIVDPRSPPHRVDPAFEDPVEARHPYQPLPTLLPRSWFPRFALGVEGLGYLGWSSAVTDATERYGVELSADWYADRDDWAAVAKVSIRAGFPDIELQVGRYSQDRESFVGDLHEPWREGVIYASGYWSLPVPEVFASMHWGFGYVAELSRGVEVGELVHAPDETMAFIPAEGYAGGASLFWGLADSRAHPLDITPSEGFSLSTRLGLRHPTLGSRAFAATFTGVARAHLGLGAGHVLTFRLGAGLSGGDPDSRTIFALGGVPDQGLLSDALDLLNQTSAGSVWLRGFPEGLLTGHRFGLLTAEWRFPLLRYRQGLGTLPLAVEDISAAIFGDLGGASDHVLLLDELRGGVGLELRFGVDLLYGLLQTVRVGYARGFGRDGIEQLYLLVGGAP